MGGRVEQGTLYVVSTPIGNLEDITLRASRILSEVDLIAAEDTRTTSTLLAHLQIRKPLISYHRYNEARRVPRLLDELLAGKAVAIVTDAGTPGISDPAYSVIRAAIDRGIRIVPVPGPSAFLSALVMSGLPMDRFVFEGFLPAKKGRKKRLEELRNDPRTIIIYESPHRIETTLKEVIAHLGDREAALAREVTKKFEEVLRGTISEILEKVHGKKVRGEIVLVISCPVRDGGMSSDHFSSHEEKEG